MEAKVPIACAFVDYSTKTGGFTGDVIYPTGDIEKDFELIRKVYAPITAKYPGQVGPIVPLLGSPSENAPAS